MTKDIDDFFRQLEAGNDSKSDTAGEQNSNDANGRQLLRQRRRHTSLVIAILCLCPLLVGLVIHPSNLWFWVLSWLAVLAGIRAIRRFDPDSD